MSDERIGVECSKAGEAGAFNLLVLVRSDR